MHEYTLLCKVVPKSKKSEKNLPMDWNPELLGDAPILSHEDKNFFF